ncbi:MAG TPA: hypothetical protein VLK35_08190 [Methylomirabilota bacterium]|nr:hypothetical protein [Methylomirabilota bacterium]
MAAIGSNPAVVLFGLGVVIFIAFLLGVVVSRRTRRQRERREPDRVAPQEADHVAIARWVNEGRELFALWQEQVERLSELQHRLAEMAQEIGRLQTQLRRMDELHAENLRLNQEAGALVLEREQLRPVLARIGELIDRALESRPGRTGEAGP